MYEQGDIVIYGAQGICRIEAVGPLNLRIGAPGAQYYTLRSYYHPELVIYAPVDGHAIVMRDPLTRQQAEAVIDDLPNVPELRITDEKARETAYRAVLHGCDCRALAGLIKTLHHRRGLRARQGRRPTGLDDRYFRQAEDQLYGELGYVLGIAREDAPAYIRERLGTRGAEE